MRNAEYPFIAITPWSTLTRRGSTWQGPMNGLNRTKLRTFEKGNYFEIQMDQWIPTKIPDLVLTNKKTKVSSCGFCRCGEPQNKNIIKQKDIQIFGPCQITKKAVEHEINDDIICSCIPWNTPQKLGVCLKKTGRIRNKRKNQYYPKKSVRLLTRLQETKVDLLSLIL